MFGGALSVARKKRSKPWACRSKTLTPTPDLRFAGFCNARDAEATRALRPECLPAYAPKWTLFEPAGSGDGRATSPAPLQRIGPSARTWLASGLTRRTAVGVASTHP